MRPLQKEIITFEKVQPKINPKAEIRRSIDFMKSFLKATGLKTLVLGISGGQDSTLAGRLSQLTVEELRKETNDKDYHFIAIRLPYGEQADEDDAMAAVNWMKPDQTFRINIKSSVDAMVKSVESNGIDISDFNKSNMKARQRMIAQYAVAGDSKGAVVGTDHAAENITGFFTKFGDGAADIMPLFRLDKRQGKQLLAQLGAPEKLYTKVPTADLEDNKPDLPDEVALGVTYQDIDDYLEGKDINTDSAEKIEAWYKKTAHKRVGAYTVFDKF